MIVHKQVTRVVYAEDPDANLPIAIVLTGKRGPAIYRIERLTEDEIANLIENGDPDKESALLARGGGK